MIAIQAPVTIQIPSCFYVDILVQYNLDTRKASESTTNSRLSEPDTVSDLYRIDYKSLAQPIAIRRPHHYVEIADGLLE